MHLTIGVLNRIIARSFFRNETIYFFRCSYQLVSSALFANTNALEYVLDSSKYYMNM